MILFESDTLIPTDVAYNVRHSMLTADFNEERQHDVNYSAFWRECNSPIGRAAVNQYILPKVYQLTGINKFNRIMISFTQMPAGSHYRLHKDDNHAAYGFIWHLNLDWHWDYGGILFNINSDNTAEVKLPKFNNLMIVDHRINGTGNWHCVSTVEPCAPEPRISIVGFLL